MEPKDYICAFVLMLLLGLVIGESCLDDKLALNEHKHGSSQKGAFDDGDFESKLLRSGILKITYDDEDMSKGPSVWEDISTKNATKCEFNCCGSRHSSPLNVVTKVATIAERNKKVPLPSELKRSLKFYYNEGIENHGWTFGHPPDTWHGVEVRSKLNEAGLFQVMDEYNSHMPDGKMISTQYDFNFAQITYCNFHALNTIRSSHQIDGKRFPLEINMMFFGSSLADEICMKKSLRKDNLNNFVMVSVHGEMSDSDNPRIEPLIKAAEAFRGADDFESTFRKDNIVDIPSPFSITWLLPVGPYYYYNHGTFVSPPCFVIPRVYILQSPILISERQLGILTNISTKREPSGKLSCTFGVVQDQVDAADIHHNVYPIQLMANDNRPPDVADHSSKICAYFSIISVFYQVLLSFV